MYRLILLIVIAAGSGLATGCAGPTARSAKPANEPLVDTLVALLEELKDAAAAGETEKFVGLLDSDERQRLQAAIRGYGFQSLKSYLQRQFAAWPDPDTLAVEDLFYQSPYARLTLAGRGADLGSRKAAVRYTFLLFKRDSADWRLMAVSNLEKEEFDAYGTRLSYLETELPPRLRFPRRF